MAVRVSDNLKTQNDSTEFPVAFGDVIWLNKDKNGATENYSDLQTMYNNDLLGSGGSSIQVDTMPIASVDELGKIYEFIGSTGTYVNGYFYECVSDEQNPPTYSWIQKNVQPNAKSFTFNSDEFAVDSTTNEVSLKPSYADIPSFLPNNVSSSNKLATNSSITAITNLIPSDASASNKLATTSNMTYLLKDKMSCYTWGTDKTLKAVFYEVTDRDIMPDVNDTVGKRVIARYGNVLINRITQLNGIKNFYWDNTLVLSCPFNDDTTKLTDVLEIFVGTTSWQELATMDKVNASLGELCNKKIYCGEVTGTTVNGAICTINPIGKVGNAIATIKYTILPRGYSITAQTTESELNFYLRWHRESDGLEAYAPDGVEMTISYMIFY